MMHVVALNQFYAPDSSATAQLLAELAEGLVGRGHRVTVVTSGPRFARTFQGGRGARVHETRNGVELVRIPATHLGKGNLVRRAADYASFYLGAVDTLLGLRTRPDVLLPLTTPPFLALAAELAAATMGSPPGLRSARRHVPVVALVQDLYPDIAVRLGILSYGGLAHRSLAALGGASLRRAARVIALSEPMAAHLLGYGVEPARLDVIPNWALAELDAPAATGGAQARLEYGLGDRFVVMYSGNLGAGHQFETLLAAARRLRDRADIAFVFIGAGVRKPEVERFVQRERLDNVKVFPLAPKAQLAESLAAADLHVITLRDGFEGLVVPSKLYGILAAERPALYIGPLRDSVATTLRQADAGVCFESGDVSGVVQAVQDLAAARATLRAMGQRGRAFLQAELGRERAVSAYEKSLAQACRGAAEAPSGLRSAPHDRSIHR